MRFFLQYFIAVIIFSANTFSSERRVLLEMFTNSHCYPCVAAYEYFKNYSRNNPNVGNSSFIMYHITADNVEDSIYFANRKDSDERSIYYGSYAIAPLLFTDGIFVGTNTKTWEQYITSRFTSESPFEISISGTIDYSTNNATVNASIKQTDEVVDDDLVVHMVITESVYNYIGKNGVTPQIYAMRKIINGAQGETLTISNGETKNSTGSVSLSPTWEKEKLFVTVFVQSKSKKTVYQSEMRSLTFFAITSVEKNHQAITHFELQQNYPNPFNPSTTIEYILPESDYVTLTIVDALGRTVAVPLNTYQNAGTHVVPFHAENLSSGIYFYTLQAGKYFAVKKLVLLK